MGTDSRTHDDFRREMGLMQHRLAGFAHAEHTLPAEVDAAEEHARRAVLAFEAGYPDDAWWSLISARRYLNGMSRTQEAGPPRAREMTLQSPIDAWTTRSTWPGTDGSPHVLAALCGVPLREVAPLFPERGWVRRTLQSIGAPLAALGLRPTFRSAAEGPPMFGVGVVQFDGPWNRNHPHYDPKKKLDRYAHWVALHQAGSSLWVYDPWDLAWIPRDAWERCTIPFVRDKRGIEPVAAWSFRGFHAVETARGVAVRDPRPARPAEPEVVRLPRASSTVAG